MAENRGVVYLGQNKVEVQSIDFPKMENPAGKKIGHAVILKVVSTNICGSDQHMVRGRTTAPAGMVLGHEITGEVIELAQTSSTSRRGSCLLFRSTSPAAVAAPVVSRRQASASMSIQVVPAEPTAMSIWVAGSAVRPNTSWSPTPISI